PGLRGLGEAPLVLFFNSHRDLTVARRLYLFFMEKVRRGQFAANGAAQRAEGRIGPGGVSAGEATLPYSQGSCHRFGIRPEYVSWPEKFMYARIGGLQKFADIQADTFRLTFEMSQTFPDATRLPADQISLNATPAVNLFESEGQALLVSHARSEYPVR